MSKFGSPAESPSAASRSVPTTLAAPAAVVDGLEHRHARRVLLLGSLGMFVVGLDTTIVNIAFTTIGGSLHASAGRLAWVLNVYSLVFAALLIPAGWAADRYGRKRVFLAGLVGFAAMSALCAAAPDIWVLIARRGLQAVCAAFLVPSSLALILREFPPARRPMAVGTWGSMGAVAAALAPTAGALLTEYAFWRWIFLINVPIAAAMAAFGSRVLREARAPAASRAPDPVGTLLVAAIPALLSLALIEGPYWRWSDPRVVGGFVLGFVLLPVFLWRSAATANPVMDLALFKDRRFRLVNASTLLFATAFFGVLLSGVVFLQTEWHYSALRSALATVPGPLVVILLARPAGRMAVRLGYRTALLAGAMAWFAGSAVLAEVAGAAPHWAADWLPGTVLTGIGAALTLPVQPGAATRSLPPPRFAVGSAINASFRQCGAVLGVSIFVAVQTSAGPATYVAAFHHARWAFAALGLAAGLVVCLPSRGEGA